MKFELFVALRYLRAKRKQTMVSVISAISVLGIAAGVMALVISLALSTGFKEDIQNKILGATPAIHLFRADSAPLDYQTLLRALGDVPHVTGSAPAILKQVFVINSKSNQGSMAMLKGVDPNLETRVSDFFSHIVTGDPHALNLPPMLSPESISHAPENIFIGKAMADTLDVTVGDTLKVFIPMGRMTPLGMNIMQKPLHVAGIFESGLWDIDLNWAYVNIETARRLFSFPPNSALFVQFKIDDLDNTKAIAKNIRQKADADYSTSTWIELNKDLISALELEEIALFITIGLIVLVASLNIVTTLIMMVLEKQKDIAILTAMGATSKTIHRVFIFQGLIIGLIGTVIGDILGITSGLILNHYKIFKLKAEIYSIPYVPFHVHISDALFISALALLISFLATLYPAWSAARLDPVEVMRYE
jgi:lipoprotein-releasing system permease protein